LDSAVAAAESSGSPPARSGHATPTAPRI